VWAPNVQDMHNSARTHNSQDMHNPYCDSKGWSTHEHIHAPHQFHNAIRHRHSCGAGHTVASQKMAYVLPMVMLAEERPPFAPQQLQNRKGFRT
jgi:hypothetical protein